MNKRLRAYLVILLVLYVISVFGISFVRISRVSPFAARWHALELRLQQTEKEEFDWSLPTDPPKPAKPNFLKLLNWRLQFVPLASGYNGLDYRLRYIAPSRIAVATLIFGALAGIGFFLFHRSKSD